MSAALYPGLSHRQYTRLPGVSASQLRTLRQGSPAHLRQYLDSPDEDTSSRGVLRAIHALVLEPQSWEADFAVFPGERRAGGAWTAWRDSHAHRTILTQPEAEHARAVSQAVLAHPIAGPMLTQHGVSEVSGVWTDSTTGLPCRLRIDRLQRCSRRAYRVIDLKTVSSNAPHKIRSIVGDQGWHIQLAHYMAGVSACQPGASVYGALVTVEDSAPYDVAVWGMGPAEELVATEERARLLATYAQCLASGQWPGRYQTEQDLSLPAYCYPQEDEPDV
jgi:exodeoxyribonuclease VIII